MILDTISIKNIDLGVRAREDYKDLDSLARSIKERGLICPIAVSKHPRIEGSYLLAAGGRRMAAMRLLGLTEIPCRIYEHELTELELKSIELEENIKREDLGFHEEVKLSREILRLQQQIHGKKTSTNPEAPGVSLRDTAKLLGVSNAKLSQDISIADALDEFPELHLERCKNRAEALKVLDRVKTSVSRQIMSEDIEKKLGKKNILIEKMMNSFIIGDFFEKVRELPKETFDLVEIDPPYAIALDKVKKVDASKRFSNWNYGENGYNEVLRNEYDDFMLRVLSECYRVMKSNSWLLLWLPVQDSIDGEATEEMFFPKTFQNLKDAGFNFCPIPAIWTKPNGQTNQPSKRLGSAYECFVYAHKGSPSIARQGRSNVYSYNPTSYKNKIHPTERPLEMMQDILTTFGEPGSTILVPFLGSGNTLIAATLSKMVSLGYELTQEYKSGYIIRLKQTFDNDETKNT